MSGGNVEGAGNALSPAWQAPSCYLLLLGLAETTSSFGSQINAALAAHNT